ncbi:hypothetical protein J4E91_010574 [Alternaria rosae]|nr:hypothetical protein J4E91_010574 [Alternaria rosae]
MRLLYTTSDGNFKFTEDIIRTDKIPPYAILSHTWGDEEVVFNDVKTSDVQDIATEKKGGWDKIRFCARQAKLHGLEHFWVDTCCIDKANNTELSEAINSMFRWYQKADKCYVYLPDVEGKSSADGSRPSSHWKVAFRMSRWFTRGWTLQELLAPRSVEFFSADGARLGDKDSLKQTIHEITEIPIEALSGSDMSKFDITKRFSWAQNRQTTREEDGAYCLLGIVDCHLPLIYGEGKESALKRLRKEMQGGERLGRIRSWLSAPDPAMNYHKAHKQRQAGTGLWLLSNEKFKKWKEDAASRLWLYGIPGCGKTILSSTVIESLQHHCGDDERKVTVYFYFDFNDAQKQVPELMLRSLLRQLLQRLVTIPEGVDMLFSSCKNGKEQPSLPELLTVTPGVMRQFSHVYVVLDALDESAKRPELMEMLETVGGWQLRISHLLMTSRKERDIEMSLETFVVEDNMICLQREVVDADILRFVQQKLRDDKRLAKWNQNAEVRQEIETALMREAQGMFRWAICQLDVIAECRNLSMLRKSLATLPQTLDQTYDRILTAINEKDRMYTIRILQWLTFSARPLYLEEVAEVVAIDIVREPAFDPDEVLMDPLEALEICSSLVTIVVEKPPFYRYQPDRRIVALAHYSVQEYLVSERIRQGPAKQYSMKETECHKAMTIGCLGYLNRFQQPLTDELYEASALATYSAQFWSNHLQKTGDGEEEMSRLAINLLLMDKHVLANLIRLYNPDHGTAYDYQIDDEEIATPLYYASFLGLILITRLLLDQGVDVNAQTGPWGTALFGAAEEGHLAVVNLLVNAGADVNMSNGDGRYPIQIASEMGEETLVKLLIDARADVNARHGKDDDALMIALLEDDEATAKLLIDVGADANTRDDRNHSALQVASSIGQESAVRLLIRAGADVNAPGGEVFGNALLAAAEGGHTAIVELLLDEGAKINAQHSKWGSALHGAVRSSSEMTTEVLLRRGASVASDMQSKGVMNHAVDSPKCTPSLVRMLQQYSVPLDTIDANNMTPLHYCAKFEHEAIAKQLIDAGVPIDSKVRRHAWPSRVGKSINSQVDTAFAVSASTTVGLTPLHFAALKGKARMARFLLEHGADPNALSEYVETPLHLALRSTVLGEECKDDWDRNVTIIPLARNETLDALLADPRTSLTAVDNYRESYLHCVGYGRPGSVILVQRLISRGADPHLINSSQQTPLCLATQAEDNDAVKVMLRMGANVPPDNEDLINALHHAAGIGNHDILVGLLQSEQSKAVALVTSKDKNGRSVLHRMFWAEWHEVKTVQWLLDHGADGSELDNFGISPLAQYLKSSRWILDVGICQLLLDTKEAASFVGHEGQTLGHFCAKRFNFGGVILKVLHEGGVELRKKDCRGRTVLHYAVLYNTLTKQVLGYLLNVIGITADEKDDQGRTALRYAYEKADPILDRDPWAFKRWEEIRSMLSELQEREVPPYSSNHVLQTTLPTPPFHSNQIETDFSSSAPALACSPYLAQCSNLQTDIGPSIHPLGRVSNSRSPAALPSASQFLSLYTNEPEGKHPSLSSMSTDTLRLRDEGKVAE